MLSDMGINVVEDDEPARRPRPSRRAADAEEDANELAEQTGTAVAATTTKKEPTDRTDDPVRMYLREMGSVELLSREGEIAIAKRIEAGRETMIAGLCESPLTFQAIIIWRDELNEGEDPAARDHRSRSDLCRPGGQAGAGGRAHRGEPRSRRRRRARAPRRSRDDDDITNVGGERAASEEEEDDEDEASLSLAAMEAELRPQVMETLDVIADTYKKLRKLQDQQVENRLAAAGTLSPSQERRLQGAEGPADQGGEVAVAQPGPHRGAGRAALRHQQAAGAERGQAAAPGRKLRRQARGVPASEYQGSELDPNWMKSISNLSGRGWKEFTKNEKDTIRDIRAEIQNLATETGDLDRRIPQDRQPGAEGRARSGDRQEGNGRGEPAPRHLDRQEIHQPRPAVPRSDSGRQYRPDEGGRQVRVPPRLQVLDLCDMVDPAGDHPLDRRPGAHHPHSGAHDRDDQQDRPHVAPDAARDRPRADAGGTGRKARHAARKGAQGPEDRQGADLASKRRSATRRIRISAISSRTRSRSCRSTRRSRPICARRRRACWPR